MLWNKALWNGVNWMDVWKCLQLRKEIYYTIKIYKCEEYGRMGCKLIRFCETMNVWEVECHLCPIDDYLCLWGFCLACNNLCDNTLMILDMTTIQSPFFFGGACFKWQSSTLCGTGMAIWWLDRMMQISWGAHWPFTSVNLSGNGVWACLVA